MDEPDRCPICLENETDERPLRGRCDDPACKHVYHADCLDDWLAAAPVDQKKCPVCKRKCDNNKARNRVMKEEEKFFKREEEEDWIEEHGAILTPEQLEQKERLENGGYEYYETYETYLNDMGWDEEPAHGSPPFRLNPDGSKHWREWTYPWGNTPANEFVIAIYKNKLRWQHETSGTCDLCAYILSIPPWGGGEEYVNAIRDACPYSKMPGGEEIQGHRAPVYTDGPMNIFFFEDPPSLGAQERGHNYGSDEVKEQIERAAAALGYPSAAIVVEAAEAVGAPPGGPVFETAQCLYDILVILESKADCCDKVKDALKQAYLAAH